MAHGKSREITREQQIAFLRKIDFFHDFSDDEINRFLDVSRWLKVPANTLVIREKSRERVFYILVRGEVSVFKESGGKPTELTRLYTGDCFGEMALVTDVRRTAGVKTVKDSYLLMVEPDIINTSDTTLQLKFYRRFCEILVNRLISANLRIAGAPESEARPPQPAPAVQPPKKEERPETSERAAPPPPPPRPKPPRPPVSQPVDANAIRLPPMPNEEDRIGKTRIRRLVTADRVLPVCPVVAARLDRILHGPHSTNIKQVTKTIRLDPALSLRVLQIANSSYYRRAADVLSVAHAMVALGMELIHEFLTEYLGQRPDSPPFAGIAEVHHQLWRHSIIVGRVAERLQAALRLQLSIDIGLAGVLHDVGIFALDPLAPTFYAQILRDGSVIQTRLIEAEHRYIGIDHATAGFWMAEKLGIPEPYLKVMHCHHEPEQAREHQLAVAIVHLADIFAARHGAAFGKPAPESVNPLDSFAWVMIQDQHKPFLDVNLQDFVDEFNQSLAGDWKTISDLPA